MHLPSTGLGQPAGIEYHPATPLHPDCSMRPLPTATHNAGTLRRNQQAGMTLFEVVLAMFMLATIVLSIFMSLRSAHVIAERNLLDNAAFTKAQAYMEDLKTIAYPVLRGAADSAADTTITLTSGEDFHVNAAYTPANTDFHNTPANANDDLFFTCTTTVTASPNTPGGIVVQAVDIQMVYRWRLSSEPAARLRTATLRMVRSSF
jgi:Tfp pilus assembly protein PilV